MQSPVLGSGGKVRLDSESVFLSLFGKGSNKLPLGACFSVQVSRVLTSKAILSWGGKQFAVHKDADIREGELLTLVYTGPNNAGQKNFRIVKGADTADTLREIQVQAKLSLSSPASAELSKQIASLMRDIPVAQFADHVDVLALLFQQTESYDVELARIWLQYWRHPQLLAALQQLTKLYHSQPDMVQNPAIISLLDQLMRSDVAPDQAQIAALLKDRLLIPLLQHHSVLATDTQAGSDHGQPKQTDFGDGELEPIQEVLLQLTEHFTSETVLNQLCHTSGMNQVYSQIPVFYQGQWQVVEMLVSGEERRRPSDPQSPFHQVKLNIPTDRLGHIQVTIGSKDQQVRIDLRTDRPHTAKILEDSRTGLHNLLATKTVPTAVIDVKVCDPLPSLQQNLLASLRSHQRPRIDLKA